LIDISPVTSDFSSSWFW